MLKLTPGQNNARKTFCPHHYLIKDFFVPLVAKCNNLAFLI